MSSVAKVDVVIVGAGISGLVCASELQGRYNIAVLEARTRVGGRMLSPLGVDLGPSWNWPSHNKLVTELAKQLHIDALPQRLDGTAFVREGGRVLNVGNAGEQMAPCGPGAVRFRGGYSRLPIALAAGLPENSLQLGCKVVSVVASDGGVKLSYKQEAEGTTAELEATLHARRVVIAMPPGVLASSVIFEPALPEPQHKKMSTTATWCGDWCKVIAYFKTPFWRARAASGVCATPGPISIWWEGGAGAEVGDEASALIGLGFGEVGAALMEREESEMHAFVVETLGDFFGKELVSSQLETVQYKCWMLDPLTFASSERQHRQYGHPLLRQPTMWGVHFAGTETEDCNGHVEGAVAAGQRAAKEVIQALGVLSTSL